MRHHLVKLIAGECGLWARILPDGGWVLVQVQMISGTPVYADHSVICVEGKEGDWFEGDMPFVG